MAVVKSKRKKSELEVLTKARKLAAHTINMCNNEKMFPKRRRWQITGDIVNQARTVHNCIRKGNSVFVKIDNDYKLRRDYQNMALAEVDALLGNMDLAYEILKVSAKRLDYWVGLAIEVQALIRAWRKSDYDRYNHLV